jgi:hypothetical protein
MKIISGGQTGVDRAALDAALSLGIDCGGWCPDGRRDENGILPAYLPVKELPGASNLDRTVRNVKDADGTVIFHSGTLKGGTLATAESCTEQSKPCLLIDAARIRPPEAARHLREFVRVNEIEVLNIAGPRASQWSDGYNFVFQTLESFCPAVAPSLSFVVPAHNEEHELPETLRAIRTAAGTARATYEIIVVDDASTDATDAVARQAGARVVSINRRHIAAARNAGGRAARGEFLFFVDADTRIAPAHVTKALEALAEGSSGGSARLMMDQPLPWWGKIALRIFSAIYFAIGKMGAGAFLFTRRTSFETIGGFDEQYFAGEEVYFTLALKSLGRFKILREPIVTSARKLRMHSPGSVLAQFLFVCLSGPSAVRTRDKLALWYDGKRESAQADERVERVAREV